MDIKLIKKLITPTIMMLWALYYFVEIQGKQASAGLFIRPVFWVMLALYVLILWMDVRDWKEQRTQGKTDLSEEEKQALEARAKEKRADLYRTAICIAGALAYVILFPVLGFFISTTLFLFIMFCWLKAPNKIAALILAATVAAGMYLLFKVGLKVPLPTGFLGFI